MIIEKLHIDKFAGLSDFDLELGAGLNIIEGKNESGKSTVAAFIKFLFYGLSGQKVNGEELSERERYLPFDSAFAGGSAVILSGGKRYILERRLSVSSSGIRESVRDEVILIDEASGEKLAIGKDAGQVLFGVGQKVFADTAYFRQLADSAPNRTELTEAIGNILFSGEEGTDAKKAMKRLEELRTALRHKKGTGGELADLEAEIAALNARLNGAKASNKAIIALEGEISERTSKLEMLTSRAENAKKRAEAGSICRKLAMRNEKRLCEEKAEEIRKALEALAPGGALPSAESISAARVAAAELPVKEGSVLAAENELKSIIEELDLLPQYDGITDAVNTHGGADALRARVSALLRGARARVIWGLVFLIPGIAALVSAFMGLLAPYVTVLYGAGAGLCAFGVLLMLLSAGKRSKARSLIELFGRGCSYESFCDGMERYERDNAEFCRLVEKRSTAEEKLTLARAELDAVERGAAALLSELGGTVEGTFAERLNTAAALAEKKRAEAGELTNAYNAAKAGAAAAEREVGEESDDELKTRLTELGIADTEGIDVAAARKETEFYRTQADMQEKEIYTRRIYLAEHKAKSEDPCEIAGKLSEAAAAYEAKTRQYNAVVKAIDALGTAGQNLRGGVAPFLSEGACRRMNAATNGKYSGLRVDGELSAVCIAENGVRSLEHLSAGTRDLAYISLRLALVDLLYKREKPPLVFDESFAHQDRERTALALKLLSAEGERGIQSLLFTCRSYEAQSAQDGTFRHITLP
ncbi:MAG: AAA family ATPase [Clostridia bacterium]|nr:AAA family ATPase [Clostridia bacterium]